MKILEGNINLVVQSVTNIEEIKSNLTKNLAKYRNIIWSEETRKDIQELISELKPERTKIKKVAAEFNKQSKAIIKTKYDEIKEIEALLDEVINPLEQGEKDYLEKCRLEKLEKKKAEFEEIINLLNETIEAINEEIKYLDIPIVEFRESWASDSSKTIQIKLNTIQDEATRTRQTALDRIDLVNTQCELLKSQYDLTTAPNGILILGKDIHTMDNAEIKNKLEEFASDQAEQQIAAEEREAERVRREEEAKHQAELEKARAEERAKLGEVTEIKKEIEQKIEQHNEKPEEQIKKYKLEFKITSTEANLMMQYFKDNNIKYEVIR